MKTQSYIVEKVVYNIDEDTTVIYADDLVINLNGKHNSVVCVDDILVYQRGFIKNLVCLTGTDNVRKIVLTAFLNFCYEKDELSE